MIETTVPVDLSLVDLPVCTFDLSEAGVLRLAVPSADTKLIDPKFAKLGLN